VTFLFLLGCNFCFLNLAVRQDISADIVTRLVGWMPEELEFDSQQEQEINLVSTAARV
jgi:hypothetical protein